MVYLILSVLLNVLIFVAFKVFVIYKIDRFKAIVMNYLVCVITGTLFIGSFRPLTNVNIDTPWLFYAVLVGLLFIFTFNLMAHCTHVFGITVSSVASKISMVIPVLINLLVWRIEAQQFNLINYFGIALAIVSVVFTSIRTEARPHQYRAGIATILIPFGVFLFSGLIDLSLNYANWKLVPAGETKTFAVMSFAFAALIGLSIIILKRQPIRRKELVAGIMLGVPNYFSIYFLLLALHSFNNNGALLYPIFNIGIILTSSLVGVFLFNDRLTGLNKLGLIIAVIAIILVSRGDMM